MFEAGTIDPFADVPQSQQSNKLTLFYASDRVFNADKPPAKSYSRYRSDRLDLGQMTMTFGPDGAWPQIAAASRDLPEGKSYSPTFTRIERLGQLAQPDYSPDHPPAEKLPSDGFINELETALGQSSGKTITLYFHGFKSNFAEAAYTAAEYDLYSGGLGPFILYSWPSYNSLFEYSHDRDSTRYTETHARRLIELLAGEINAGRLSARRINIIAHSSGAEIVGSVLRELSLLSRDLSPEQRKDKWHIGCVLMVAPDISTDVARERMLKEDIQGIFRQIVVYSSYHDNALGWASTVLYRTPRIGSIHDEQFSDADKRWLKQAPNIELIDIDSRPYAGIVKHTHHRFSPAVVSDILLCLRSDLPPEERGLVRSDGQILWRFADDYPHRVTQAAQKVYGQAESP